MLNKVKYIYDLVPKSYLGFLKNVPDPILFGNSYSKTRPNFDRALLKENVTNLLVYSRAHTEYGRDNIPNKFHREEALDILEHLPLTSSSDVSSNFEYFISDEYDTRNSYITTTGGTGRNPCDILLANSSFGIEWRHMHSIWNFAVYSRKKNIKLTLRGKTVARGKLFEFNPIYNELVVDTFKLNRSNFLDLYREIVRLSIRFVHGYPSLVKEFMYYCQENNLTLKFDGIFLGSEGASIDFKNTLSSYFGAKVVHWYGQTEKLVLAVDEGANDEFRVFTSYGLPRVVNGELVGSSFVNRALPLINFKTGDGAELLEKGESLYIKNLSGRWGKDFVYLNKEKKIPTSSINLHSEIQSQIIFMQIIQAKYGSLVIKIVPKNKGDNQILLNKIYNELKSKLKDFELDLITTNVLDIERSHRGKMLMLVQNIKDLGKNK
ncbi:hypothetical protein [Vibrio breoganii]|uniref:hypothetical protein n=1 Tax=Vibrio breoganii TaxID=553239 RepID=UPI000C81FD42|nr:hypothetical protein [Vibrio breoganii]PML85239.1 hypothetical protein BCT68_07860 [Vibrio breoganii]